MTPAPLSPARPSPEEPGPKNHVFVCYGLLSFEAAVRIALEQQREWPRSRFAFLLLSRANESRVPSGSLVKRLPRPLHEYSAWTKPFAIASWFQEVLREIREQMPGPIHAYVPHPVELPGNHFLFHGGPQDLVDLLPDGLINYVPKTMTPERVRAWPRYLVRVLVETLAAKVHGFSYRPVLLGHQTQWEKGLYDASWAFNSEGFLTQSGRMRAVPPPPMRLSSERTHGEDDASLLFLDQELTEIVGPRMETLMRHQALSEIIARTPGRVLYKAHPRGRSRLEQLRDAGLRVIDLTGPIPAEEVALSAGVKCIVGFYSTTLMLVGRDAVAERIAVLPDARQPGLRRPKLIESMRRPLQATGVRVVAPPASLPSSSG